MRFTIRDVIWMTALVALAFGWWVDHARNARSQDEAKRQYDAMMDGLHETQANLQWKIESLVELQKEYDEFKAATAKAHRPPNSN